MSLKPFKIIVHNDTDGGVSAICIIEHIKQKYGPEAKYSVVFKTYQNVDTYVEQVLNQIDNFEHVFIADISVKPYIAKDFTDKVILIDHHDSALELQDIPRCIVDTRKTVCGATLCYKHLLLDLGYKCDHLKTLVGIAKDYDCWIHALPNKIAKNLNYLFYLYWGEKFIERFQGGFKSFNVDEKKFLTAKWKETEEEIKKVNFIDLMESDKKHKNKICVAVLDDNKGEVNEICEHALDNLHYKIIITANAKKRKISIRAHKSLEQFGFHVGFINQELGIGGGHQLAGGASYDDDEHFESICSAYAEKICSYAL